MRSCFIQNNYDITCSKLVLIQNYKSNRTTIGKIEMIHLAYFLSPELRTDVPRKYFLQGEENKIKKVYADQILDEQQQFDKIEHHSEQQSWQKSRYSFCALQEYEFWKISQIQASGDGFIRCQLTMREATFFPLPAKSIIKIAQACLLLMLVKLEGGMLDLFLLRKLFWLYDGRINSRGPAVFRGVGQVVGELGLLREELGLMFFSFFAGSGVLARQLEILFLIHVLEYKLINN